MTACFKLIKALRPEKKNQPDTSYCAICVYHSKNLDRALYDGKGIGELPDDGCSLEFPPGGVRCNEMKTSNCSVRKTR